MYFPRTIGMDLVSVQSLGKPSGLLFLDYIYDDKLEQRRKKIEKLKERIKNKMTILTTIPPGFWNTTKHKIIKRFKQEDTSRVVNFILHQGVLKSGQDDILKNEKMHSYSVIPYTPNNEHLITASMIYMNKSGKYFDLVTTFSVDDYFNWYTPRDRVLKIKKLREKHEYLAY